MARHRRAGGATVALLAATLACTSREGSDVVLDVAPRSARADVPLEVAVEGLPPDTTATIVVTSTDDAGRRWSDEAEVDVGPDGAVAPVEATRATTDLLTTLRPDDGEDGLYVWGRDGRTLTVAVEGTGATVEVRQHLADEGVADRPTTLAEEGFVGHLWTPADGADAPGSALVLIGGSEGGLGGLFAAPLLASHGHPALQLGLFGLPGLPDGLESIPIETVAEAVRWLGEQPGVDPDRVWVLGGSRGSEAALLVGAHFPELVAGVIATVPSSVVSCSVPDCDGPAWTLDGQPLPYSSRLGEIPPDTVIPVERIDGPVLTTCGERDSLWGSCAFADLIAERRGPGATDDVEVRGAAAGHGAGLLAPQTVAGAIPPFRGGDPLADEQVRLEAWPALLALLDPSGG
jgi:dienelactone hydrolase